MSKQLQIKILGSTGIGKTTIAALITSALLKTGLNVKLNDPDIEMKELSECFGLHLEERIEALKQSGLIITVETVQTVRDEDTE